MFFSGRASDGRYGSLLFVMVPYGPGWSMGLCPDKKKPGATPEKKRGPKRTERTEKNGEEQKMSSGTVVQWGTKVFVLAEDEQEAQALFKGQNVAIDMVEEVDRSVKSKPARIVSKSGTQVAYTDTKKKGAGGESFETIVVLTYNVLHEIGDPVKHDIKKCYKDVCIKNVCKFIEEKASECDFIGIQEYVNIDNLRRYSKKLRSMGHSHTAYEGKLKNLLKYGPITFYDTAKYEPDEECSYMKLGFKGGLGRGIQINFFSGWLCVINVHAGHKSKGNGIGTFQQSLDEYLNSKHCSEKCKETFIRKLKEYEIIMLGDMNDEMLKDFSFTVDGNTRRLVGRTRESTCCGDKQKMDGDNTNMGAYDHVLSTFSNPSNTRTRVYKGLKRHSDHNPVKATIVA